MSRRSTQGTTHSTGFRLSAELLEQVDHYAERLSERTGLPVDRTTAVRRLLALGLRHAETTLGGSNAG